MPLVVLNVKSTFTAQVLQQWVPPKVESFDEASVASWAGLREDGKHMMNLLRGHPWSGYGWLID